VHAVGIGAIGVPSFASASGRGQSTDESMMRALVEWVRRQDPACVVGDALVVAHRRRLDGQAVRRSDEGAACLIPCRSGPVFIGVLGEEVPSVEVDDPLEVPGVNGPVQILDIELNLVEVKAYRGAISDDAASQDSADR
jgi:hypothetical protein